MTDEFTRGYIEAALWSSTDESTPQGGDPLDKNYGLEDIAPETLEQMAQDCRLFQTENAGILLTSYNEESKNFTPSRAGFCFWLNRNGHGSGFWDEEELLPKFREPLSEAAHKFGEFDLYIGDDGKIYGSGG